VSHGSEQAHAVRADRVRPWTRSVGGTVGIVTVARRAESALPHARLLILLAVSIAVVAVLLAFRVSDPTPRRSCNWEACQGGRVATDALT
jgi:hypothetical protein